MATPPPPARDDLFTPPVAKRPGIFGTLSGILRTRILAGLIAALPIALTFFIIRWLYVTAIAALTPLIEVVRYVMSNHDLSARVWYDFVAPAVAVVVVLCSLYLLGLFLHTRVHRMFGWVLLHVPIFSTIFKAVNNVFQSIGKQIEGQHGFKRVVLVEFPHPGARSLAFVTNTLRDATTDRPILCVCVLTGVMPPSGFTLFVPEESVTDIDWSVNQTLQAILSGGITAPAAVHYFHGLRVPPSGPIIDAQGHPIAAPAGEASDAGEVSDTRGKA
jgi:uncharacterized membrane protein